MFMQIRWWISAAFAGILVLSVLAPIEVLAQETPTDSVPIHQATIIVDTASRVEPAVESPQVEFLAAGSTVALLDAPFTSMYDGQLWIQIATAAGSGFVLMEVVSTTPPDEQPAPSLLIIAWKLVQSELEVACRAEPLDEADQIGAIYPGQEVGVTAEPVDGWQAIDCDGQQGFVPVTAFEIQTPLEEPAVGEAPSVETPPTSQPEETLAPEPAGTETVTPAPEATETPVAEETPDPQGTEAAISPAPAAEDEVQVAAAVLAPDPIEEGNGIVSAIIGGGTGYVRATDGDGVRCRAGANTSAATITVLPEGAAVTSRGAASGSWQPVYCAGQNGFVWAEYVGNAPGGSSSSGSTGTVRGTNGDWLRCRASADYGGAVITALAPGASATIRGSSQGGWIPVICGGQNGFVHSDFFGAGSASGSSSGGFSSGQAVHVANTDGDGVRFRTSASYSGAVISLLFEGSGLTVRAGSVGEWVAVSRGGSNGFIHRDFLAAGAGASSGNSGSPSSSALAAGSRARVTESLRLRSGASLSAQTLTIANAGIVVKITGSRTNGFYPVSWDGLAGYMYEDFLVWTSAALSTRGSSGPSTTTPVGNAGSGASTATGNSIVNYALRYLGYPYVWAGRGPSQFDCAGFVYWVNYNITGVNLVGGVINQYTYGRPVPWGQLQPGDSVFFANTYQPGLSHNGIYIGNNQFVHASNPTDGVIVSNLTNSYYLARWYGARRII